MASELPKENFQELDIRKMNTIPVFAKRPQLVSNHHPDSYEFVTGDKKQVEWIKILDTELFWETTDYLVVVTRS